MKCGSAVAAASHYFEGASSHHGKSRSLFWCSADERVQLCAVGHWCEPALGVPQRLAAQSCASLNTVSTHTAGSTLKIAARAGIYAKEQRKAPVRPAARTRDA